MPTSYSRAFRRALRPHQWLKNALIAVPALAAHRFDLPTLTVAALAIASFSLCASGGYVLNDLLDVEADRRHHRKRYRPFASGDLAISTGIWLIVTCWVTGFGLAAILLPVGFVGIVSLYLVVTMAYSLWLKREPVLDVMVLASFYVIRIWAGGVAAQVPVSTWFLAFILFVSLSLAFLKRFIEVKTTLTNANEHVPGRGYLADDANWLHAAGLGAAYVATVVLALYANSPDVTKLYTNPERLVLICPLLMYWATHTWLTAHRQQIHDDPVVAVAKDPRTYIIGILAGAIVLMAI